MTQKEKILQLKKKRENALLFVQERFNNREGPNYMSIVDEQMARKEIERLYVQEMAILIS